MYVLVKYIDDGVYYVCMENAISERKNNIAKVTYKDGYKYKAEIIGTNECKEDLDSIRKILQATTLVIDCIPLNLDQYSTNFIDSNSDTSVKDVSDPFDDDDSIMDPSYEPFVEKNLYTIIPDVRDTSSEEEENTHEEPMPTLLEKIESYTPPKNNKEIKITSIPHSRSTAKKYFCLYCKQLFSKLVLHLERVHKSEEDVKKFMVLPKGCEERKQMIEIIRKQGCFEFNTNESFNDGHLILTRRPRQNIKKSPSDFKVCPCCKGLFAKSSIRKHYTRCVPNFNKGDRSVSVMGKRVYGQIHKNACPTLRNHIFPVLRNDDITRIISYDDLIISFGNRLCSKYRLQHLYKMVRAKLRLLGRFMIHLKGVDETVKDFASTFIPCRLDSVIHAVNNLAGLNAVTQEYKSPATAADIGTTLKKCGKLLVTDCIKKQDETRKREVEDFLKIMEDEFPAFINKTVMENQLEHSRRKKIELPCTSDIIVFNNYLDKKRDEFYKDLLSSCNISAWKSLASYTLTSIQIFNRKRAGEIERMTIQDFNSCQSVDDPDLIKHLPVQYQESTKKYMRFVIRGKKARGVPVLLSTNIVDCIKLLLKHRNAVGVGDNNPYVFGLPGKTPIHSHLNACELMRKFSEECGASNPQLLRGTQLRKQIATQSSVLNLKDNEVSDLANFLGHAEKIHRDYYKLPVATREIGRISQLLEMGIGKHKPGHFQQDESIDSIENQEYGHDENPTSEMNESLITSDNNKYEDHPRDSWSETDMDSTVYGRNRCTSPYGNIKRKSWSSPERNAAMKEFEEHIKCKDLPSLPECSRAIKTCKELKNRTPTQLKAWISNQMKKNESHESPKEKKKRNYWTTEEKAVMNAVFSLQLRDGILPGLEMCSRIIKEYPILRSRNAASVKAWVNNTIKKRSKDE